MLRVLFNIRMSMFKNANNSHYGNFAVEERRRQVAALLAQAMTQDEIAAELGVSQMTISRDIQVLREMSSQFIFDLAKSDLGFYYAQCIESIEQVNRKAWRLHNDEDNDLSPRDRLLALKIIIEASQAKFGLFEKGPELLNAKTLETRLGAIEKRNGIVNNQQSIQTA
jgi:DNA-binding CsgD family transcriptional regulator